MEITYKCKECGSTEINNQAVVIWNGEEQDWVIDVLVDGPYCAECSNLEIEKVETETI